MRNRACLLFMLLGGPALGAVLADDAYVCRDKRVALQIVDDVELATLDAGQLSQRASAAGDELAVRIAVVEQTIARTRQRVDTDREAVKSAKALEFQAGIRQNLRPTEQAVRDGEAKLAGMNDDRERLLVEQEHWTEITASCAPPTPGSNIAVVRVLSPGKLALARVGTGAARQRVWVPSRFIAKATRGRK
jgi:hypothetical protein